jgi:NAD-dependent dihydropyrimidine dehydrogenase PreA subunit
VTFVITELCADVKDRTCIEQCPVDCIYEGDRALYINPVECIECGACEPVCPVEAIYYDADLPEELAGALASNADFFAEVLPGRTEPLGNPGGYQDIGLVAADTPFVAALPVKMDR